MKIGFVIYNQMTALDFVGVYDAVTRLRTMSIRPDIEWEICAREPEIIDFSGLRFTPTRVGGTLAEFDLVIVPGGKGSRRLVNEPAFLDWLRTAHPCRWKASVCTGSLLWGAAGFLHDRRATTHPSAYKELHPFAREVSDERVVADGDMITARGVTASIDLGLYLVERIAGRQARLTIQRQMDYFPDGSQELLAQVEPDPEPVNVIIPSTGQNSPAPNGITSVSNPLATPRTAQITRQTKETQIELKLNIDGRGRHTIETGIGFLDHMLTHLAVHGFFDLDLKAKGDLEVDPHHTVEDIALVLGAAFSQALGERKGLVRAGSVFMPMDETLAFVALDFSGRPYTVFQVEWRDPSVGGIATSLFNHFFQSFASAARCTLHARVEYGRDDHHQAEALFKALGRALDAATKVEPRLEGAVPSTKGTLIA